MEDSGTKRKPAHEVLLERLMHWFEMLIDAAEHDRPRRIWEIRFGLFLELSGVLNRTVLPPEAAAEA